MHNHSTASQRSLPHLHGVSEGANGHSRSSKKDSLLPPSWHSQTLVALSFWTQMVVTTALGLCCPRLQPMMGKRSLPMPIGSSANQSATIVSPVGSCWLSCSSQTTSDSVFWAESSHCARIISPSHGFKISKNLRDSWPDGLSSMISPLCTGQESVKGMQMHSPIVATGRSKKLNRPWTGLFKVLKRLSEQVYRIHCYRIHADSQETWYTWIG